MNRSWIQVYVTVWAEKVEPVTTVETHSFLLLRYNVLTMKTREANFNNLYIDAIFLPPTNILLPWPPNHILLKVPQSPQFKNDKRSQIVLKSLYYQKNCKLSENSYIKTNLNCPGIPLLTKKSQTVLKSLFWPKNHKLSQKPYVNQKCHKMSRNPSIN